MLYFIQVLEGNDFSVEVLIPQPDLSMCMISDPAIMPWLVTDRQITTVEKGSDPQPDQPIWIQEVAGGMAVVPHISAVPLENDQGHSFLLHSVTPGPQWAEKDEGTIAELVCRMLRCYGMEYAVRPFITPMEEHESKAPLQNIIQVVSTDGSITKRRVASVLCDGSSVSTKVGENGASGQRPGVVLFIVEREQALASDGRPLALSLIVRAQGSMFMIDVLPLIGAEGEQCMAVQAIETSNQSMWARIREAHMVGFWSNPSIAMSAQSFSPLDTVRLVQAGDEEASPAFDLRTLLRYHRLGLLSVAKAEDAFLGASRALTLPPDKLPHLRSFFHIGTQGELRLHTWMR